MSVDQERAEKAVEYLIDSARKYGLARADVVKAEAMLKHVKALAMSASDEKSAAAQEREAYASVSYLNAIEDHWKATVAAETLKADREAAQATIAFWQTVSANERGAERGMRAVR